MQDDIQRVEVGIFKYLEEWLHTRHTDKQAMTKRLIEMKLAYIKMLTTYIKKAPSWGATIQQYQTVEDQIFYTHKKNNR